MQVVNEVPAKSDKLKAIEQELTAYTNNLEGLQQAIALIGSGYYHGKKCRMVQPVMNYLLTLKKSAEGAIGQLTNAAKEESKKPTPTPNTLEITPTETVNAETTTVSA